MILCAGESLVDVVPGPDGPAALPGGAVFNTALGLGRLDARAGYLWPLSTDAHGRRLRALLDEAGVDTRACPDTDLPTASAHVTLRDGNASYDFRLTGTTATALAPAPLETPRQLPLGTRALFIGSISLAIEPAGSAIEALAHQAARARLPVMIDPNLRPALIDDPASLRARLDRLFALAAVVKLSSDDLDWLAPGAAPAEAAQALADRTGAIVLHTQGGDGAALRRAGRPPLQRPALRVPVVDTIGAGDSFNAGFLAALQAAGALDGLDRASDDDLDRAVASGIRMAAATVGRQGADPPWRRDLPTPDPA